LSNFGRQLLRATRRADSIALDGDGRVVTDTSIFFDEAEAEATNEAAGIVEQAQAHADELVRVAAQEAATIRHEAYAEGREQGNQDGVALARTELVESMALLQAALNEAKSVRDRLLWAAEHEIVELAIAATRTVIGEQVLLDPALTVDVVERALERAAGQNVVALRLHPTRLTLIDAHLSELRGEPLTFELRGDDSVEVGGCIVDTSTGQIDARLDVQLDEVARELRDALPTLMAASPDQEAVA
jgi:flagellar assembly protein FliH